MRLARAGPARHATDRRRTVTFARNGSVSVTSYAEFGYELVCIVPYAHWHAERGMLHRTVGVKGSAANFFFSPAHEETAGTRHNNAHLQYGIEHGVDGLNPRCARARSVAARWSWRAGRPARAPPIPHISFAQAAHAPVRPAQVVDARLARQIRGAPARRLPTRAFPAPGGRA